MKKVVKWLSDYSWIITTFNTFVIIALLVIILFGIGAKFYVELAFPYLVGIITAIFLFKAWQESRVSNNLVLNSSEFKDLRNETKKLNNKQSKYLFEEEEVIDQISKTFHLVSFDLRFNSFSLPLLYMIEAVQEDPVFEELNSLLDNDDKEVIKNKDTMVTNPLLAKCNAIEAVVTILLQRQYDIVELHRRIDATDLHKKQKIQLYQYLELSNNEYLTFCQHIKEDFSRFMKYIKSNIALKQFRLLTQFIDEDESSNIYRMSPIFGKSFLDPYEQLIKYNSN